MSKPPATLAVKIPCARLQSVAPRLHDIPPILGLECFLRNSIYFCPRLNQSRFFSDTCTRLQKSAKVEVQDVSWLDVICLGSPVWNLQPLGMKTPNGSIALLHN
jgi:hypothetical protein